MTILSRKVTVSKSYEEVYDIIKSSAYCFPKGHFSAYTFSMHCAKRYNRGVISVIPVNGKIIKKPKQIDVHFAIQVDFGMLLGCVLFAFGIVCLLLCAILHFSRWIPCVGASVLGMIMIGHSLWEGKKLLDRLEQRIAH